MMFVAFLFYLLWDSLRLVYIIVGYGNNNRHVWKKVKLLCHMTCTVVVGVVCINEYH